MKILLATPAPRGSKKGNRITAIRWAEILVSLGHYVDIVDQYDGQKSDLMIALHAKKSFPALSLFRKLYPEKKTILALTGTDLYADIKTDPNAQLALEWANRIVVLQDEALTDLPSQFLSKTEIIYQSVNDVPKSQAKSEQFFDLCVAGHLRAVKDPFRTAWAVQDLSPLSKIRVQHLGKALSEDMQEQAEHEMQKNPRYHWLGEHPRWKTLQFIAKSHLLVHTSEMEGGAQVISEALMAGVPVISSKISGSVGMLGKDYVGYFPFGDTAALQKLLLKAEIEPDYYKRLQQQCAARQFLFSPQKEKEAWSALIQELQDQ